MNRSLTKAEEKDMKETQKLVPVGIGFIGTSALIIGLIKTDTIVMIMSALIILVAIGTIFSPEREISIYSGIKKYLIKNK